jgi:hypothetical protein
MNPLFLHDVADKVGNPGIIGAIAAGLATLALLAGVAQVKKKNLPQNFPADPDAAQAKYGLAFTQLQEALTDSADNDRTDNLLQAMKNNPAAQLSISAFGQYRKSKGAIKP